MTARTPWPLRANDRRHRVDPTRNERYTAGDLVGVGAHLAGLKRFDLDVAACRGSFFGACYFTKKDNGLEQTWYGAIWCNPPYDDCGAWVAKAWYEVGRTSFSTLDPVDAIVMLLPATRTEQPWWQSDVEQWRDGRKTRYGWRLDVHFVPGRPKFTAPGHVRLGSSPFPVVFLIWRRANAIA